MLAYRLTHSRYADDLSGFGAYKVGGRWNPRGYFALYLSEHPCGAILEALLHMPPQLIPDDYSLVSCQISENADIEKIDEAELAVDWRKKVSDISFFQKFGKIRLFDKKRMGLWLPSSVAYPSYNLVLNPRHEHFSAAVNILDIKPYIFDFRLIQLFKGKTVSGS